MKTLTIKVSEEMFAEIAGAAKTRKVSKSEIARERLAQKPVGAPAKKTSLWSRMEDLVIDSESLPTDLSSNEAYMEGYGKTRAH